MLGLFFAIAAAAATGVSWAAESVLTLGIRGPGSNTHSGYKYTMAGLNHGFRSRSLIGRMVPARASALSYPRHFAVSHR